jgi:hypothetical protein
VRKKLSPRHIENGIIRKKPRLGTELLDFQQKGCWAGLSRVYPKKEKNKYSD